MIDGTERELLVSVFLMEAWDAVALIEEQAPALAGNGDVQMLYVVAHRLRGAAALHGFPQVSAIAAQIEEIVDGVAQQPPDTRRAVIGSLGDLVAKLKHALENVAGPERSTTAPALEPAPGSPVGVASPVPVQVEASGPTAELAGFFMANAEVLPYFIPEATEHLENMTASLLVLEQRGGGAVAELFRAVHTLKGAAYTVGCRPIGDLAHRVEDLLAAVREDRLAFSPALVEGVLTAIDVLRLMLRVADGTRPDLVDALERAHDMLGRAAVPLPDSAAPSAPAGHPSDAPEAARATSPAPSHAAAPPPLVMTSPSAPAGIVGATATDEGARLASSTTRVSLQRLDALMNLVGELVSARTRLERRLGELDQVADLLRFTGGRMAGVVGEFERKYVDPRLSIPDVPRDVSVTADTPRVPVPLADLFEELEFDRYDDFNVLARSVGELSTDIREIHARLGAVARGLRGETAQIQRLNGELRSQIGRARLVPIARLFGRLPRQVREIARAADRTVVLTVEGETVEVDSSVIEQLADPLLHLLQNAIVHGIESEEERRRSGKRVPGSVSVRALQKAGTLRVEIADDGRGIDVEAVKARALTTGLVTTDVLERLDHRSALGLIFLPGLSTAAGPTTVAGRGVGMDVVRASVARMGGDIEVDTRTGEGTRFTITLPLSVAITDVLLVRVGREVMAVAASAVKAILLVRRESVQSIAGEEHITLDEETLRLVHLGDILGVGRARAADPLVVLALRSGHQTVPVAVDELLRKEEVVVKGLGRFLEGLAPYAGATISPEGRVVMILEPARLLDLVARSPEGADEMHREGSTVPLGGASERRVLLVDDSVSVRRFVGQMLERAGLEVVTANDGAEALERLREVAVDAVVTDLEMPKRNGFELIRDLRRRPTTRRLPIVVLTTRAGDKHAELARQLGATHYVTKPVEEQGFVRLVEALTEQRNADAGVTTS